ncbi:hypothetical protein BFN03_16785 [Rhodococcus sp. WMMA185]|uniref:VOC family protein n=1 Tax=Rhodococcus sp. WMMA185 TaxID=679318 RepID=UPI00087811F8|nr:VOC family protein [Rhodococcus sp. WMMA185]AOW93748.1 hypothetical protein BFN03_16785 [Rhodococcus sp. WMMA185]
MNNSQINIDRSIYPMPTFATFPVSDFARSVRWYEALGFVVLAEIPAPDGATMLVHLRRMRYQDILLVLGEPAPGYRSTFDAGGDDLERRAASLLAEATSLGGLGSARVEGPDRTQWYTNELVAIDADGYSVVLSEPLREEATADAGWTELIETSVQKG